MRLLLMADVHLDSPFAWAGKNAGVARRQAIRDALSDGFALARAERVDAVCLAGDLFEHERVSRDTGKFLAGLFESVSPMPVLVAPGNHDWFGPASLYARTAFPGNTTIFAEPRLVPLTLQEGFTVWGAAHTGPASTPGFLGGFRVDRGGVHVALFHGSEQGSLPREGVEKIPHSPFTSSQIPDSGLHHALVGHFHTPADATFHTYPGNPEPLAFGESGARGAVIVEVDAQGHVSRDRRELAHTSVSDATVDVTGLAHGEAVRQAVIAELSGRSGVVRLTVTGELEQDVELHPELWPGAVPHVESLVVRTRDLRVAHDVDLIQAEPSVRGQFVRDVLSSGLADEMRRKVVATGLRAFEGRSDLEVL